MLLFKETSLFSLIFFLPAVNFSMVNHSIKQHCFYRMSQIQRNIAVSDVDVAKNRKHGLHADYECWLS